MPGVCTSCSLAFASNADLICCKKCQQKYHPACVNIGENELAYLRDNPNTWTCCTDRRTLRSGSSSSSSGSRPRNTPEPITAKQFAELMSSVRNIASDVSAIRETQEDIKSQLSRIDAVLLDHSKVLAEHKNLISICQDDLLTNSSAMSKCQIDVENLGTSQTELSKQIDSLRKVVDTAQLASTSSTSSAQASLDETFLKLKRSHNLIVSAVPESPNDNDMLRNIVDTIEPSSSQAILSISRINSANVAPGRPRLVKVTFNNIVTPRMLLRNKAVLLNTEFKRISLRDDKTPHELRALETLRQELRTRLAAGERDLTIKYVKGSPKIVHTQPKN